MAVMTAAEFRNAIDRAITRATKIGSDGEPADHATQLAMFMGTLEGALAFAEPALASRLNKVGRIEVADLFLKEAA